MTAIWLSRSVPGTSKIYTARNRDPIALTAAYIAHTGAPKPDARLRLPHCRRWHDRRQCGNGILEGVRRGAGGAVTAATKVIGVGHRALQLLYAPDNLP